MPPISEPRLRLLVGSQLLYGPETLRRVEENARALADRLNASGRIPARVEASAVVTDAEAARRACEEADADPNCVGVLLWMHTFSPAKMWIAGLSSLSRPVAHLHTQHDRDLPWATLDMAHMNLHQSAHGDREAGALHARMRLRRKVIVGHATDPRTLGELDGWTRAAIGAAALRRARFCRFGDNMREVSVTEGDKVAAQMRFGFTVDGYGVSDLVEAISAVEDAEVERLLEEYRERYEFAPGLELDSVRAAARQEAGLRTFLRERGYDGFTTTFEDLRGLDQLPGLAAQRLMAEGFGFGAEGDWKTCAMVHLLKTMASGRTGGTSFMEDYTYHLDPNDPLVLGAHMLEVCPSIAAGRPRLEVHPLSIGGKPDPARLVFDAAAGSALVAALVDLGDRFRLVVNEVEAVAPPQPLPKLPVARAVWRPKPDFATAAGGWIEAGGGHHTAYSYAVSLAEMRDFAEINGVEIVGIGDGSDRETIRERLRWNDAFHRLAGGPCGA